MLTERPPFHETENDLVVIERVVDGKRPVLDDQIRSAPELSSLLIRCWDQQPKNRPSATDIVQQIEKALQGYTSAEPSSRRSSMFTTASFGAPADTTETTSLTVDPVDLDCNVLRFNNYERRAVGLTIDTGFRWTNSER